MRRSLRRLVVVLLASASLSTLVLGCGRDKPSLDQLAKEAKDKEDKRKKDEEEARAKEKAATEALDPQVVEKRRPLDKLFGQIYDALPDGTKIKERKECPDAKILADAPSEEKRKVLLVNQENLWTLAGKNDANPDAGALSFHTMAADEAQWMRRPEGKETFLLERGPSDSSDRAKSRLEAIDWIAGHRYIGVAVFTRFRASSMKGGSSTPARVEGWTIIFDKETQKPICHVESWGENLASKAETLTVGRAVYEDLWTMWLHTTSKNLDAVSKQLGVEGVSKRK